MTKRFSERGSTVLAISFLIASVGISAIVLGQTFLPVLFPGTDPRAYQYSQPSPGNPLDLRTWNISESQSVLLEEGWSFYWNRLTQTIDRQVGTGFAPDLQGVAIRQPWTMYVGPDGQHYPTFGYGTFELTLWLPPRVEDIQPLGLHLGRIGTAGRVYWNGIKVADIGSPGTQRELTSPAWQHTVVPLPQDALRAQLPGGIHTLTIEVSNFHDRTAGLPEAIQLTTLNRGVEIYGFQTAGAYFMVGLFAIMSLYHLFTYLYRKEELAPLMFGIICGILALRILAQDSMPLGQLLPNLDYQWLVRINFLTFTGLVPPFGAYLSILFPYRGWKPVLWVVTVLSVLYSVVIVGFPTWVFGGLLIGYQLVALVLALILILRLIIGVVRKEPYSRLLGAGFLAVVVTMLLDMARANNWIAIPSLISVGIMIFVFFQSLILIRRSSEAIATSEELGHQLSLTNTAMERFIPREFLRFIGRQDITQVQLGDHKALPMVVMAGEIQNFTGLTDRLDPEEIFEILNILMGTIVPLIRDGGGYVDKYRGNGFLALFPQDAQGALSAGVQVLKAVRALNRKNKLLAGRHIEMSLTIHSGNVTLGTIGEKDRMDGTVVSEAVNLATRMLELSRIFESGILMSEPVRIPLGNVSAFSVRNLGSFFIKGRAVPVELYEVFDNDSRPLWNLKRRTVRDFERAVYLANSKEKTKAKELFTSLALVPKTLSTDAETPDSTAPQVLPRDPAVHYYLAVLSQQGS